MVGRVLPATTVPEAMRCLPGVTPAMERRPIYTRSTLPVPSKSWPTRTGLAVAGR